MVIENKLNQAASCKVITKLNRKFTRRKQQKHKVCTESDGPQDEQSPLDSLAKDVPEVLLPRCRKLVK
jgi:hypothetical protein